LSASEEPLTRKKKLSLLVGIPLAAFVVFGFPYARRHHTCLRCRLYRKTETYCGVRAADYRENQCSQWYARTRPDHQHVWSESLCAYDGLGFVGLLGFGVYSCPQQHPILAVDPDVQKEFLCGASRQRQEEFFRLLESEDWRNKARAAEMVSVARDDPQQQKGQEHRRPSDRSGRGDAE
jgi:hypothetical protein